MLQLKKLVKPQADNLRQLTTTWQRGGERIKFALQGRPKPSSAILLVGSGRSGTTWLTDILTASPGIQQIFEPLNPVWIKEVQQLTGWDNTRLYLRSFYLRASGAYPDWHEFLSQVLTGQVRCAWTDYRRNSYFPDQFLVKLIRANLMQGYIYDHFQPRIIYIMRHPCATVQSRLALRWYADTADALSQEELVEDYLHPWIHLLEKEKDILGAQAAWWAIENLVASRELAMRPHYVVTYEALCLEPQQQIRQIFSWLDLELPSQLQAIIDRPSSQSRQDVFYKSTIDRLSLWQRQLTQSEQRHILNWAHRLEVTCYNDQILPVTMPIQPERDVLP